MKIAVNCGHTLKGPDSNGNEGNLNRKIGYLVESKLKKLGHTVIDCTVNSASSVTSALDSISNKANANGCELFISIHHNAGGGNGTEILTYRAQSNVYTINILRQMQGIGYKSRGVKDGSGLSVIRKTNMKALLIEVCFYDNEDDMRLWSVERISDSIVKGIDGKYQPIVTGQPVTKKAIAPVKNITGSTTADTKQPVKKMSIGLIALIGIVIIGVLGKAEI